MVIDNTNVKDLSSIADRLVYLRNKKHLTLSDVANLFNVNKSTVSRWETNDYWERVDSTNKRLLLMQLVELYEANYGLVVHGEPSTAKDESNILIVDDDVTSLSIITLMIKSIMPGNYNMVSFTEPDKALEWAKDNTSALVFCDYRMPGLSGDTFIKKLRGFGKYDTVPVIATTQLREMGVVENLFSSGATHILQKPINQEKLQGILKLYNFD